MANFTVVVTGVSLTVWTDPADGSRPTRLNASAATPHRYYNATTGAAVTITATVAGVSGPMDATLSGETFTHLISEAPTLPAPAISSPAGQSSVASFTPLGPGLYLFTMRRVSGGAVHLHIYATTPS